jgi:hypothetical protein
MRRWWWIITPRWVGSDWSPEEREAMWLIHLIGVPLFAISCYTVVMSLFSAGLDPLVIVILGVLPPYVASLYAARRLIERLKPDLVKQADENATRRIAREEAAG